MTGWTLIAALASPAVASERLSTPVTPLEQRIDVTVDPARRGFSGSVAIRIDVPGGTTSFQLHGEGLIVHTAAMQRAGRRKQIAASVRTVGTDGLVVRVDSPLRAGVYTLTLDYDGPIHDQPYGLYRFEAEGAAYAITQLEADEARTAWPCFDEPAYKIPWQLTVTRPAGVVAISNAPIEQVTPTDDGNERVRFAQTPPMPSYGVALAVGPYVATPVPDSPVPASVWTVRGRAHLAGSVVAELPAIVTYLEGWFGSEHPFDKLDFIAVPDFVFGGMENPGAVVLHEGLLVDPERASDEARELLLVVTAHEVAHMWFGNLVTLAWWDDFWLNESFATWVGQDAVQALAPEYRTDIGRVASLAAIVRADGRATSRPVRTEVDPSAVFETANFAAYPKGQAVLDMVRAWIGPAQFQDGLRSYLDDHAWGNATGADLFAALEEASGQPVGEVFTPFLDQPGAPAIHVTVSGDGVRVAQRRYARLGVTPAPLRWTVPMMLRVGRLDGTTEVVRLLLEEAETVLDLGPVAWVHPAAEGVGYYAWSLDPTGTEALLDHVDALSAPERRSVLASMSLQVESGALAVDHVLGSLAAFDGEADARLQRTVLDLMDMVTVVEELDDAALEDTMNAWRRARFGPMLARLGLRAVPGEALEEAALRRRVVRGLARAGDPAVRAWARELGAAFLEDPNGGDPDLASWGLGVVVEDADVSLQADLIARAQVSSDLRLRHTYLVHAASVPGERARDVALALALDPATDMADTFVLVEGVDGSRDADAEQDWLLGWMMDNYDTIAAKLPPPMRPQLARAGTGCDLGRLERAEAFFLHPDRAVLIGTERILAEARDSTERCMLRTKRLGGQVRAFLEAWEMGAH